MCVSGIAGSAEDDNAESGKQQAQPHQPVHVLAVDDSHEQGCENGVDKEDGAGYSCIHKGVSKIEQYG